MKPLILFALSVATLLACSCGGSEKDKMAIELARQAKDDSIRLAQLKQVKDEQILQEAAGDSLSAYNTLLRQQQKTLVQVRTAIYTANNEMTQAKAFRLGRPPREREMRIHNQEVKIQVLLLQQTNLQTAIQHSLDQIAQFKSALAAK